jgi:hypothetical protein
MCCTRLAPTAKKPFSAGFFCTLGKAATDTMGLIFNGEPISEAGIPEGLALLIQRVDQPADCECC